MKLIHTKARSATFKRDGAVVETRVGRFSLSRGVAVLRGKFVPALLMAMGTGMAFAGHAMAQATSPTGGLGAQINTMSSEGLNSGSELFGVGCYLAAALCFGFGVWALWQSRQPQNRESGHVMRGVAGLVLCGLRILPMGRLFDAETDIYPQIVDSWLNAGDDAAPWQAGDTH